MNRKYKRYLSESLQYNFENSPYHWITQVHNLYEQRIEFSLKKHGLDHSRIRVLSALKVMPQVSLSSLSEVLVIPISSTTKIVYRLQKEGLVNIYNCPLDARVTRSELTELGSVMVQKINEVTRIVSERSYNGIAPVHLERMLENLKHIFYKIK